MKNFITRFIQFIMLLLIFEVAYLMLKSNPLIVSPFMVLLNVFKLLLTIQCWKVIAYTTSRILIGFLIAMTLGITLAILASRYYIIDFFVSPIMKIIKIAPIASFIVITFMYIKNEYIVAFISFLMVLPIFYYSILNAIRNVDNKLLEMAKIFNLTQLEKIKYIYFPSIVPSINSSIETGIGFAFKSGITAEILVLPSLGLGTWLYEAKIYIDALNVFSYTIIIILASMIIEKIVKRLLRLTLNFHKEEKNDKIN